MDYYESHVCPISKEKLKSVIMSRQCFIFKSMDSEMCLSLVLSCWTFS